MAAERPSGALETKEAEKTSTKIMAKAPEKEAVLAVVVVVMVVEPAVRLVVFFL